MTIHSRRSHHSQSGGITILVVLSMLVLLTVMAVGMSRNSLREVFIVGSSRQSAVVRQAADTGLEYAIVWMQDGKTPTNAGAISFQAVRDNFTSHPENVGVSAPVPLSGAADVQLPAPAGQSRSFALKMLRVGKIQPDMTTSAVSSNLWNDVWVIQSSGTTVIGSTSFQHDKEVWRTTPDQTGKL